MSHAGLDKLEAPAAPRASPIDKADAKPHGRRWDDVPVGTKVTLLVLTSSVGGCLVGMITMVSGGSYFMLVAGLLILLTGMVAFGRAWLTDPLTRFVDALNRDRRFERPNTLRRLPLDRLDEIGQVARYIAERNTVCQRDYLEARQLRRTLDQRIRDATRRATRRLRRIAMRDSLTDLGNRRFLDENLSPIFSSVRASGSDLICIMIDVDNFKPVNDTLGHAAGDALLVFLGSLLRASVRHEDLCVRLGGDEFVLLLPEASMVRDAALIEQVQTHFTRHTRAQHPDGPHTSLSIGVTSMRRDGIRNGQELLVHADRQLYAAKNAGKGQSCGL